MGDVRYTAAPGTPLSARLKLPFTVNYLIGLIWTNYSNSKVLSFFSLKKKYYAKAIIGS